MTTKLVPLTRLSRRRRRRAGAALGTLDEIIAGTSSGHDLIEANLGRAPLSSWLIRSSGIDVGVFALAVTPRTGYDLQASIYLIPGARGTGLFAELYLAAGAAAHIEGLAVCSSVVQSNDRSVAAHRKLFGGPVPRLPGVRYPEQMFFVHDLRNLPRIALHEDQLYSTIRRGLRRL